MAGEGGGTTTGGNVGNTASDLLKRTEWGKKHPGWFKWSKIGSGKHQATRAIVKARSIQRAISEQQANPTLTSPRLPGTARPGVLSIGPGSVPSSTLPPGTATPAPVDWSDPNLYLTLLDLLMRALGLGAAEPSAGGPGQVVIVPVPAPPAAQVPPLYLPADPGAGGDSMAYVMNTPFNTGAVQSYSASGGGVSFADVLGGAGTVLGSLGTALGAILPGGARVATQVARAAVPIAVAAGGGAIANYLMGPSSSSGYAMRVQRTVNDSVALWRSDLRACKRVQKIARLAHRATGPHRSTRGRRRGC